MLFPIFLSQLVFSKERLKDLPSPLTISGITTDNNYYIDVNLSVDETIRGLHNLIGCGETAAINFVNYVLALGIAKKQFISFDMDPTDDIIIRKTTRKVLLIRASKITNSFLSIQASYISSFCTIKSYMERGNFRTVFPNREAIDLAIRGHIKLLEEKNIPCKIWNDHIQYWRPLSPEELLNIYSRIQENDQNLFKMAMSKW